MNTLGRYLSEIRKTRSLGSVPETSYYPALAELLSTVGMGLSPKVRCIVHPKSQGAGIPDLALFSVDQIPANGEPLLGVMPSRGGGNAWGAHAVDAPTCIALGDTVEEAHSELEDCLASAY